VLKSVQSMKSPRKKLPYQGDILIKHPLRTSVACFKALERAGLSSKDLKVVIKDH
jgi:hypothetical protein